MNKRSKGNLIGNVSMNFLFITSLTIIIAPLLLGGLVFAEQEEVQNQLEGPNLAQNAQQGSTVTIIARNDEKGYHDTSIISNLRYFFLGQTGARFQQPQYLSVHNYSVSAGYSEFLGVNALMNVNLINRDREFRGEKLQSDNLRIGEAGLGLAQRGILALSLKSNSLRILDDLDIVAGLGYGFGFRISLHGAELALNANFLYGQLLFSMGPSVYANWDDEVGYSLALNASYFIRELNKSEIPIIDVIRRERRPERKRYFRPGIEVNYPVYRSEIKFWDNEYRYATGGAGLFFRIGPEPLYFTTGAYMKFDFLEGNNTISTENLNIFGINIPSIPLGDMNFYWYKYSIEIPLLLNYTIAKQVRFTGGLLLDFDIGSDFWVSIDPIDSWWGWGDDWGERWSRWEELLEIEEQIERQLQNIPIGDMYWVFGVDFDIVRYWGIGVKFLIHNSSFGGDSSNFNRIPFEPSRFQTRVSTYFVF
ncbi:MAG: hypothetical protein LBU70_00135 [Chitinispirillales bacterium]|jgi:hypothetical protein|nr:hypothetical protein [Chitinispirillales bacterium]